MRVVLGVLLCTLTFADESTPGGHGCQPPSPAVVREIERRFPAAGEHATESHVCVDGNGERTQLKLTSACMKGPAAVSVRYRVTVTFEVGGECTPYPDCARAPPPETSNQTAELQLTPAGLKVPASLPGVRLRTPLGKKHSTGCHGDAAAFVPRPVK